MARLDNFGGVQIFFTFSCADARWLENLSSFLREYEVNLTYNIEDIGSCSVNIECEQGILPLEAYLMTLDDSIHEIMRQNVVTATRIFKHRF